MDTDDLSEMAWDIIAQAAQVSDTLKAELGALTNNFTNEDDWLCAVRELLQEIIEDPVRYMDYWNLEEFESVTTATIREFASELRQQASDAHATPLNVRSSRCCG